MMVEALWKVLGESPAASAAQLAELLSERFHGGQLGFAGQELKPYYELFVTSEVAGVLHAAYDKCIAHAITGETVTGLDPEHPLVGIVLALAGLEAAPETRAQSSQASVEAERVMTEPRGPRYRIDDTDVPVSLGDRLVLLISYMALPAVALAVLGTVLYFGEPLLGMLSRSFRSPSSTGDRVATELQDANEALLSAEAGLAELDRKQAELCRLTEPVWHDPETQALPSAVRRWLLMPVRTAAAREEQDEVLLRYLMLVRTRRKLQAKLRSHREELRSMAPGFESGSSLGTDFDSQAQTQRAARLATRAAELTKELEAISTLAQSLRTR
jgi:hypothetical protein